MGARGMYMLNRDTRREYESIQKKKKKRGLWSKIGMTLAGGAAAIFTGGLLSPFLAALAAGGAAAAGGFLGDKLAKEGAFRTGKARIKGTGKFLRGERSSAVSQLHGDIVRSSLYTAGAAGLKAGAGKILKEGVKTGDFSDLFKAKEGATGIGKAGWGKGLDIGGSWGAKGIKSIQSFIERDIAQRTTGPGGEVLKRGYGKGSLKSGVPDMEDLWKEEMSMPATQGFDTQDVYRAKAGQIAGPQARPQLRGKNQWDAFKGSEPVMGGKLPETLQAQYKTPGAKGRLQRLLPGGESGYQGEIPQAKNISGTPGLSHEEVDIRNYYEKVGMDDTTHISRKMPKHTKLQDTFIGDNFYESSNIKNTPRYVAGRQGEESYFSRALDTDDISPMDIRGGKQGITMPEIKHIEPNRRVIPGTGSYSSYGGGTDFTQTSAWEGVGESFGVKSPNLVENIGETFSSSPSYDYQAVPGKRQQELLKSLRYQNLFGR